MNSYLSVRHGDLLTIKTHDDILSITGNLTFLSPQTDILSSILSDREFDSPPFIRILLFLAALYSPGLLKYLNATREKYCSTATREISP